MNMHIQKIYFIGIIIVLCGLYFFLGEAVKKRTDQQILQHTIFRIYKTSDYRVMTFNSDDLKEQVQLNSKNFYIVQNSTGSLTGFIIKSTKKTVQNIKITVYFCFDKMGYFIGYQVKDINNSVGDAQLINQSLIEKEILYLKQKNLPSKNFYLDEKINYLNTYKLQVHKRFIIESISSIIKSIDILQQKLKKIISLNLKPLELKE